MRMKEIQLLAILAVIAVGIITLSMWGGRTDDNGDEARWADDEAGYSRSDDSGTDDPETVVSDELDELIRLLGDSSTASGDGMETSRRDGGGFDDLLRDLASLPGEDGPLQAPPGRSIDDRLAETEPEEIPLTRREQTEEEENGDKQDGNGSGGPVRHNVTKGETLSEISQQYYGTSRKWRNILEANKDILKSPESLRPDMSLLIPEAKEVSAAGNERARWETASLSTSADTTDKDREYTVKRGDTLWAIALEHYGDGSRHKELREANRDVIPANNILREGMVIVIPE